MPCCVYHPIRFHLYIWLCVKHCLFVAPVSFAFIVDEAICQNNVCVRGAAANVNADTNEEGEWLYVVHITVSLCNHNENLHCVIILQASRTTTTSPTEMWSSYLLQCKTWTRQQHEIICTKNWRHDVPLLCVNTNCIKRRCWSRRKRHPAKLVEDCLEDEGQSLTYPHLTTHQVRTDTYYLLYCLHLSQ